MVNLRNEKNLPIREKFKKCSYFLTEGNKANKIKGLGGKKKVRRAEKKSYILTLSGLRTKKRDVLTAKLRFFAQHGKWLLAQNQKQKLGGQNMINKYVEANVDELLVLKGRVKALEGYLNSVTYIDAAIIRGIMGFEKLTKDEEK